MTNPTEPTHRINPPEPYGFETLAIRTGHRRTQERGAWRTDIYDVLVSFLIVQHRPLLGFRVMKLAIFMPVLLIRLRKNFEQRLAAMEGGESCIATASGMSAIMAICVGLLKSGDHIVSSRSVFGTTTVLFERYLSKFGIETTFVNLTDIESWKAAIQSNTRLFFLETPSNPLTEVADIQLLADLAHNNNSWLVVDNCFCTPALQKPLTFGADLIVHSATKYLDGQGRIVGGAVVGNKQLVGEDLFAVVRTTGPTMSPFNAWNALKGLENIVFAHDGTF